MDFENVLIGMTDGVANLQLPDPCLRDHYRDEEDRILWLDDDVENCVEDIIKAILRYNKDDKGKEGSKRKPIKIMIDSNGGDMLLMWSLIRLIDTSKTPVWTINYCCAFSAAGEILASGKKRFALRGSHVMLHNGSCNFGGQVDVVKSQKDYFDKLTKTTVDHLLTRTGIEPKVFRKKAPTDWWLNEEDALANGIVDVIIDDIDEIF